MLASVPRAGAVLKGLRPQPGCPGGIEPQRCKGRGGETTWLLPFVPPTNLLPAPLKGSVQLEADWPAAVEAGRRVDLRSRRWAQRRLTAGKESREGEAGSARR